MRSDEGTKELGTVRETLPRNHYLTAYKKAEWTWFISYSPHLLACSKLQDGRVARAAINSRVRQIEKTRTQK